VEIKIFRGDENADVPWYKTVDFSSIEFPSDKLTVKVLRKLHPELFDVGFCGERMADDQPQFFFRENGNPPEVDALGGLLQEERRIAAFAYAKAAGLAMPPIDLELEISKEEVAKGYKFYGLSSGPHQTQELIRSIERQARQLAKGVRR
jgi:hypothetical protein